MYVHRWILVLSFSFVFSGYRHSCDPIEIVIRIFAGTVYQQIVLFVDQIVALIFAHFKVIGKLDSVRGARLFAESTENTTGEIDSEKFRITPASSILGRL